MGTRADFYVGRGEQIEWIGSKAWDGYPWDGGVASWLGQPTTEEAYRAIVASTFATCDATLPHQGWPWPWSTSQTTDYTYTWDNGVYVSDGRFWLPLTDVLAVEKQVMEDDYNPWPLGTPAVFPDMSANARYPQQVTLGRRSGLFAFTREPDGHLSLIDD